MNERLPTFNIVLHKTPYFLNKRKSTFIQELWSFMENNDEWVIAHFQKVAALNKQNTKSWLHTLTTYGSY